MSEQHPSRAFSDASLVSNAQFLTINSAQFRLQMTRKDVDLPLIFQSKWDFLSCPRRMIELHIEEATLSKMHAKSSVSG